MWFKFLRIIIYAGVLLGLSGAFYFDASHSFYENLSLDQKKFKENSVTEFLEQTALLLTVLCFLFTYCKNRIYPRLQLSMIFFFLLCFIREFDEFLDRNLFDGAWQALAVVSLIAYGLLMYKQKGNLFHELDNYSKTFSFGLITAGMLIVFAFSRLYGEAFIWKALMEDQYLRSVKNAAEESIELLGYCILLFAAVEFVLWVRSHKSIK